MGPLSISSQLTFKQQFPIHPRSFPRSPPLARKSPKSTASFSASARRKPHSGSYPRPGRPGGPVRGPAMPTRWRQSTALLRAGSEARGRGSNHPSARGGTQPPVLTKKPSRIMLSLTFTLRSPDLKFQGLFSQQTAKWPADYSTFP